MEEYLKFLSINGGWFKICIDVGNSNFKPYLIGFVKRVKIDAYYKGWHQFLCPFFYNFHSNKFFTMDYCGYESKLNILTKPSIEDIEFLKNKLKEKNYIFNIKNKKIKHNKK